MVNIETVLYLCAKFHNFPTSGSMGCHSNKSTFQDIFLDISSTQESQTYLEQNEGKLF